ncbi:MAG TPA: diiron oxygenase [Streptosporangiaceae bacterium]|jgi:hypothetical protein
MATLAPADGRAEIRCKDGDHTLELIDRELVAERLLKTSRKHSYDPDVDVDWAAEQDPDVFYMPPHLLSLYETPLWDGLTHRQRVELSKHELASITSFGIWSELLLMQILVGHAYRNEYDSDHVAYALTEVADECRHSVMFGRMIKTIGLRPIPMRAFEYHMAKMFGGVHIPLSMFAATLVVEEFTDALQRVTFPDERIQPLVREITRIHVIEEARHIKYAREELKRQVARVSAGRRRFAALGLAQLTWLMRSQVIRPSCYEAVGLDPKVAAKTALRSPHRRQTLQWAFRKCTGFFQEVGFLDGAARKVWVKSGLLAG